MSFQIQSGGDPWLKQVRITLNQNTVAYYQNCLTHCCGLSGLATLFPYPNHNLNKGQVDEFVQLLQSYLNQNKPLSYDILFTSPEVMFTTSDENAGEAIEWLKQHPKVSKKWEFSNRGMNVVTVWAISLDFVKEDCDEEEVDWS